MSQLISSLSDIPNQSCSRKGQFLSFKRSFIPQSIDWRLTFNVLMIFSFLSTASSTFIDTEYNEAVTKENDIEDNIENCVVQSKGCSKVTYDHDDVSQKNEYFYSFNSDNFENYRGDTIADKDLPSSLKKVRLSYHSPEALKQIFQKISPDVEELELIGCDLDSLNLIFTQEKQKLKILRVIMSSVTDFTSEFEKKCKNLRTLDLYGNCINNIGADFGSYFTDLVNLNLKENNLIESSIDCFSKNFSKLKTLNLSKNSLVSLDNQFGHDMKNLVNLNLSSTKIEKIPKCLSINLPHLKYLDLSHNSLESMDFDGWDKMCSIEVLDLEYNKLSEIPNNFSNVAKNVKQLFLKNNKFESFNPEFFASLKSIEVLDLSSNNLNEMPEGISLCYETLKKINISNNNFKLSKAEILELKNNKIEIADNYTIRLNNDNLGDKPRKSEN